MSAGVVENLPAVCRACRATLVRFEEPGPAVAALEAADPGRAN